MSIWTAEYLNHSALNFGQALHGLRFLFTHPDVDRIAPPRTVKHAAHAAPLRLRRIANDLFFAILPPRWHHTRAELQVFHQSPARRWFQAGFGPYRFTESGDPVPEAEIVREVRWDPRCKDA